MENYLNEYEVAKKLKTNNRRISKWRRAGLIKGVKLSRQWIYKESDIEEFFNRNIGKDLTANHYLNITKK